MKTVLSKIIIAVLTVTLVALALPAAAQEGGPECVPASGEPLRLGAIFPQGSLFSARATGGFQGAEAMRQAINACGGINGRPVEWVYEPAADFAAAEAAALRLIEVAQVPLIIGGDVVGVSEAVGTAAEAAGVVYWEVTAPTPIGGPLAGDWLFYTRPDASQLGAAAVELVTTDLAALTGRDDLRIALVYEQSQVQVAEGVLAALIAEPPIVLEFDNDIPDVYGLAVDMRDQAIDVVIISASNNGEDALWFALREADTALSAWIQVGSSEYLRQRLCELRQPESAEALITIGTAGSVSREYREAVSGELDALYRATYRELYDDAPNATAELAASGVYMLLRYVLPEVDGAYTAEAIRQAILAVEQPDPAGLLGEGIGFAAGSVLNQFPGVIVQQQQRDVYCSLAPDAAATCPDALHVFPLWRDRALLSEDGVGVCAFADPES